MAFSYGFFDSVNGDRNYSADQFGDLFTGLISDGIYPNIGNKFHVQAASGLTVTVGSGRAFFNKTWSANTTDMSLTLELSDLLLPRYDCVYLEIDKRVTGRKNAIKFLKGEPSANPVKPAFSSVSELYQYPLAYIYIPANQENITDSDIEQTVGTSACPYVSAMLDIISIEGAFANFQAQFDKWMDSLEGLADENLLVGLKFQLDSANKKIVELESEITYIKNNYIGGSA